MKRIFTLVILFGGLIFNGYGQEKGYPNPAVAYIQKMGYNFEIRTDSKGNQYTVCIFPDGTVADAWAFFKGKAGKEFSYCAKHGYSTESQTITNETYTEERATCTRINPSGQTEVIPMTELMEKNGEPLVQNAERPVPENAENEEINEPDARLKDVSATVPVNFDWRSSTNYPDPGTHAYIGAIRDQGNCGSCYSFGAAGNAEGIYNVANHLYDNNCIDFSESFIMWCLGRLPQYSSHFYGCNGADYTYSELKSLITDGITLESYFPYTINDPGSCKHWNDPRYSFNNWYRIACGDTTAIKTAIYTYGVIDAAVYVGSSFQAYTTGIYKDSYTSCSSNPCYNTPTNHAIALVGWGGTKNSRYFILRNSWGASWGQSGYMYIDMKSARVACEGAYLTLVPVTCTDSYEPNETQSAAKSISVNTEVKALISSGTDVDWFKFSNTKSASKIEVQLYTLPANYDVYLYNAAGTQLGSGIKTGNQPEKIIYNTTTVGTYYVKVIGNGGAYNAQSCYTLLVSTAKSNWTQLPGAKEENIAENPESSLLVYPNPTNGKINLDYNGTVAGKVVVTVYSISGQRILNQEFECLDGLNSYSLDLGNCTKGMYFLELRDQTGKLFRKISLQ